MSLVALGCGSSAKGKLYQVTGSVFCDGKPAEGASVLFQPIITDEKLTKNNNKNRYVCPPAFATVDSDGFYVLTTFDEGDGARAGNYGVIIDWMDEVMIDGKLEYSSDKLGGQYSTSALSQITFTVEEGNNEVPRIDVTLAKAKKLASN